MTSPRTSISVSALSVGYRRALFPARSVKEMAIRTATGAMKHELVWALRGVGFELQPGEILGVVGANGAGKSTLLRAVAGVLPPTEGRVVVHGRVTPVLDLTTGLHPDATGRESIEFLGALLGRDHREARRRAPAIADWAGLSNYLDRPIRTYSSGMVARLSFAVVSDDEPEILLLDEILAVGDANFQTRSLERLRGLAHGGATVILVSHDLASLSSRSTRVLWLDGGSPQMLGDPTEVVVSYAHAAAQQQIA